MHLIFHIIYNKFAFHLEIFSEWEWKVPVSQLITKATKASVLSLVGPHSKGTLQVRFVIEKCELLKIFKIFTFFSG